jgi:hypothetical protein
MYQFSALTASLPIISHFMISDKTTEMTEFQFSFSMDQIFQVPG